MFNFFNKITYFDENEKNQNKVKNNNKTKISSKSKSKKIDKGLDELNKDMDHKDLYQILDDEFYILYHSKLKKEYKIKIKIVDAIFKDYSKHGNNLSGNEILEKYKIKPEVFNLIKSKLRLYKDSNVISPYTLKKLELEGNEIAVERIIDDAIDESIDTFKGKFINTYEKKFKKEAKKAFGIVGNIELYLETLKGVIQDYHPKKIDLPDLKLKTKKEDELIVILTDIHLGKKNTDVILEQLSKIKDYIIYKSHKGYNKIKIIMLGDLVENLAQSLMHSGQHITADIQDPFELMLFAADTFQSFLIDIRKEGIAVDFYGIPGNHDRITAKNEDDMLRLGGLTIYELMNRGLSNTDIEIDYGRNTINQFQTSNFNIILSHGENGFNNKKPEDLLWKYAEKNGKFNVILSGHTHEHKQQVGYNYAKIVVAPLAGPGDYDERLGLKGEVGFTTLSSTFVGSIDISNHIL